MRAALSSNLRSLLVAVALASAVPSLGLNGTMAAPLPTDIVAAAATDPGFKFEISSALASLPSETVDGLTSFEDKVIPSAVAAAAHPLNKREQVLDSQMVLSERYLVVVKPDPGAADGVDTQTNDDAGEQENAKRVQSNQDLGGAGHPQSRRQGDTEYRRPQARADATLLNLAQAPAPTGKKNRDVDYQVDTTSEKSQNKPIPPGPNQPFDVETQDGVTARTFDTGSSGIDILPKKPAPVRDDEGHGRRDNGYETGGSGASPSGPGHRALEESVMDSRGISCGGILPPPVDDTAQLYLDPSGNSCGGIGHRSSQSDHHRRREKDGAHAVDGVVANGSVSSPSGPGHRSSKEYHTNPSGSDPGGPGHPRSFEEYRLSDNGSSSSRRGKSSEEFRLNPSGSDPGGPGHYPRQLQDGPASGFNYDAHSSSEGQDGVVSLVDYEASTHRGEKELNDRSSIDLAWEKPNGGWWA